MIGVAFGEAGIGRTGDLDLVEDFVGSAQLQIQDVYTLAEHVPDSAGHRTKHLLPEYLTKPAVRGAIVGDLVDFLNDAPARFPDVPDDRAQDSRHPRRRLDKVPGGSRRDAVTLQDVNHNVTVSRDPHDLIETCGEKLVRHRNVTEGDRQVQTNVGPFQKTTSSQRRPMRIIR
jgi:hypothetical protein